MLCRAKKLQIIPALLTRSGWQAKNLMAENAKIPQYEHLETLKTDISTGGHC